MEKMEAELLRAFLEAQNENTDMLAKLNENARQMSQTLSRIDQHFTNGFRSEIKEHISQEITKVNSPWAHMKYTGAVVIGLGLAIGGLMEVLKIW